MSSSRPTRFRRTRRVLVMGLVLVVIFFLLLHLVISSVLEKIINRALHDQGWENAATEVRFVSLSRADLAGVSIGEKALQIDSIRVNYTLSSLLNQQVDAIELSGVQIRVPEVMRLAPVPSNASSPEAVSVPTQLPFRSLRFTDARILVEQGGVVEEIVLDGQLTSKDDGSLSTLIHADSAFVELNASGTIDLDKGAWEIHLEPPEIHFAALFDRFQFECPPEIQPAPVKGTLNISQASPDQPVRIVADMLQPFTAYGQTNAVRMAATSELTPEGLTVNGRANLEQQSFVHPEFKLSADRLDVPFALDLRAGVHTNLQARLVVDGLFATMADQSVRIGPVKADFPFPTRPGQAVTGIVDVAQLHFDGSMLGGLQAKTSLSFTEISAVLQCDLLTDSVIALRAAKSKKGVEASFALPFFSMEEKTELQSLIKKRAGVELSGQAGLSIVSNPAADPPVLLSATLLDVGIQQEGFSIEGLSGALLIDDLEKLRSQPHQKIKIDKLAAGKFELTDGTIKFSLEGKGKIFIEENHWSWAGGTLYSAAFLFQPASHQLRMQAVCEKVDLQQVLQLAIGEQVTGDGALYGRIPLSVGWDPYRFSIGEGYLFAAPGTGLIQVRDKGMIDQVLAGATQSLAGNKQGEQIRKGILLSLKDFEYQTLRLDFRETGNGIPSGSMHVNGKGRDGQLGLPLNLTINFSGEENE